MRPDYYKLKRNYIQNARFTINLCLIIRKSLIMKNSIPQNIIDQWLEDPLNEELRKELEGEIKEDSEALVSFRKLQSDYMNMTSLDHIPENPFFFSKLKFRMENRKHERSQIQRVRWAVYAATMSVCIVIGVMLGNQVQSSFDEITTASTSTSTEEAFATEFLVADYSIDNSLLIEIED